MFPQTQTNDRKSKESHCSVVVIGIPENKINLQGSYPFSETDFKDFSRTQIDFSRALEFTFI